MGSDSGYVIKIKRTWNVVGFAVGGESANGGQAKVFGGILGVDSTFHGPTSNSHVCLRMLQLVTFGHAQHLMHQIDTWRREGKGVQRGWEKGWGKRWVERWWKKVRMLHPYS